MSTSQCQQSAYETPFWLFFISRKAQLCSKICITLLIFRWNESRFLDRTKLYLETSSWIVRQCFFLLDVLLVSVNPVSLLLQSRRRMTAGGSKQVLKAETCVSFHNKSTWMQSPLANICSPSAVTAESSTVVTAAAVTSDESLHVHPFLHENGPECSWIKTMF